MQLIYSLADDAGGNTPCVASSQAPFVAPADKLRGVAEVATVAASHRGRLLSPLEYRERGLLPLPATYRVDGNRSRRQSEVLRYARRLMADLPHSRLHAQIPTLLREMADALERGEKLARERREASHKKTELVEV